MQPNKKSEGKVRNEMGMKYQKGSKLSSFYLRFFCSEAIFAEPFLAYSFLIIFDAIFMKPFNLTVFIIALHH